MSALALYLLIPFTNILPIIDLHLIYCLTIYILHILFLIKLCSNLSLFQAKWFSNVFEAGYAVVKRALADIFHYRFFEKSDPCQPPSFQDVMRSLMAVKAVAESAAIMEEWHAKCSRTLGGNGINTRISSENFAKANTRRLGSLFGCMKRVASELKDSTSSDSEGRRNFRALEVSVWSYACISPLYLLVRNSNPPHFIPLGGSVLLNVGCPPPLPVPMSSTQPSGQGNTGSSQALHPNADVPLGQRWGN